jgi:hypothetical protein
MSDEKWLLRLVKTIGLVLALGASMSADAGLFGSSKSWKEEVLLHDGSKIIVERLVERGGRHEIGQEPPYKEQTLTFTLPGTNQTIRWEDHYSEDIGSANFLPMALDVYKGRVYLVADTMGCLAYNKWGRPNPPYVIFEYDGKDWQRISLRQLPDEIKTPNLLFSMPDIEVDKLRTSFITSEMIHQIIDGYRQPEYRTILRAQSAISENRCPVLVPVKGGGWESPGGWKLAYPITPPDANQKK